MTLGGAKPRLLDTSNDLGELEILCLKSSCFGDDLFGDLVVARVCLSNLEIQSCCEMVNTVARSIHDGLKILVNKSTMASFIKNGGSTRCIALLPARISSVPPLPGNFLTSPTLSDSSLSCTPLRNFFSRFFNLTQSTLQMLLAPIII